MNTINKKKPLTLAKKQRNFHTLVYGLLTTLKNDDNIIVEENRKVNLCDSCEQLKNEWCGGAGNVTECGNYY